jgi:hypothetical protein
MHEADEHRLDDLVPELVLFLQLLLDLVFLE